MQAPQCLVEECPNPPLAHRLCLMHTRIPPEYMHPMSGSRNGVRVTMAGMLFDSLSIKQPLGEERLEYVLPVVRVPFIRDESTFRYYNYRGDSQERTFRYDVTKKTKLQLREELVDGIRAPNISERPIVFLVATNIPHTSIYILYQGQFYSVAFGYDTFKEFGSLYSIDIPLIKFSEARIVWIGILTEAIMERLQHEFDMVTRIVGNFKSEDVAGQSHIVERLMFFHTPRKYGGIDADADPTQWNCTKWAMYILFGDRMPANFRDLVSRTNPGLTRDQLTLWLTAYQNGNSDEFVKVLNDINSPSFARYSMGGRRRRMTKRKMRKTRKTRKTH